jgi:hypothetical protein
VADGGVKDASGNVWGSVGGSPGSQQYHVAADGTYTFDGNDNPGWEVFISYTYSIGFFAYGTVTFLTGANAGYSTEVKSFAPGVVTVALPFPFPVACSARARTALTTSCISGASHTCPASTPSYGPNRHDYARGFRGRGPYMDRHALAAPRPF